MEKILNDYLEKMENYLKPLPISERVDFVKEIKSEILELQGSGKSPEEIMKRLGDPKELARAYLGDLIVESRSLSRNKVLAICAYYSLVGLSGLFAIPILAICAFGFTLCGGITPIAGGVKLVDAWLALGIPLTSNIEIVGVQNPLIVFALSVLMGAVLCLVGIGCWILLLLYIRAVGSVKRRL